MGVASPYSRSPKLPPETCGLISRAGVGETGVATPEN